MIGSHNLDLKIVFQHNLISSSFQSINYYWKYEYILIAYSHSVLSYFFFSIIKFPSNRLKYLLFALHIFKQIEQISPFERDSQNTKSTTKNKTRIVVVNTYSVEEITIFCLSILIISVPNVFETRNNLYYPRFET